MSPEPRSPAPRVLVRADASAAIGHGHVMRCLALAQALRARGAVVAFLQAAQAGDARDAVTAAGFELLTLAPGAAGNAQADAAACSALLQARGGADLLVLDHYGLDARWLAGLGRQRPAVLVIDDLADRALDGDLLLDQNWQDEPGRRYAAVWPAGRPALFGPAHALLRAEFAAARAAGGPRDGRLQRIVLAFGGSDPPNATAACLAVLQAALPGLALDVVVGAGAAAGPALQAQWAGVAGVSVTVGASDIAARFAAADLFVGAGGSMTWERACLGLPGITLPVAANQQPLCARLADQGLGVDLGPYGPAAVQALVPAVRALQAQPARRLAMSQGLAALCDGQGADRVARAAWALLGGAGVSQKS